MEENDKIKQQIKAEHDKQIKSLYIQFSTYFKFQRKIDILLKGGSFIKDENTFNITENIYIQNMFCLIDKDWINKWKRYINYSDIYKHISKNKIKINDFDIIRSIIEKHFVNKILPPLDMTNIYKNNKLDIYSNFDIFYRKYSDIFFPKNLLENPMIMRTYPVKFFKDKYIIELNDHISQIKFKEHKTKQYFEILIIFKEGSEEKLKLLKEFKNENINEWLKKINFEVTSDIERDITIYNCKLTIFNKTLKLKKESAQIKLKNSSCLIMINNNNTEISPENKNKFDEYKQYIEEQKNSYYKNQKKAKGNNILNSNNNAMIRNKEISLNNIDEIKNNLENLEISDINTRKVLNNNNNKINNSQMTNIFANISNNNINNQIQNNLNTKYVNINRNPNLINNQNNNNNFQILNNNNNIINNNVNIINNTELRIYEHKPQNDKDNPMKVIFQNPGFGNTNILIDSSESIDELIKFYFEINGRIDLYGDKSIIFLIDSKCIMPPYSKEPVGTLVNKVVNSKTIKICVDDNDDKMNIIKI